MMILVHSPKAKIRFWLKNLLTDCRGLSDILLEFYEPGSENRIEIGADQQGLTEQKQSLTPAIFTLATKAH
jgi:hypothetical protein